MMRAVRQKGFTIVELLMVVGVIAVLMGIVTTAASSSIKASRTRRATVLCHVVEAGLSTYRAVKDKWPTQSFQVDSRANKEDDNETDPDLVVLRGDEVRTCVRELVVETRDNRPVMDVSGLFVSRQPGKFGQACYGMDFMSAVRGTRESAKKMKVSEMYFGYPERDRGYFRHFKMIYSIPTDTIRVGMMDTEKAKAEFYE